VLSLIVCESPPSLAVCEFLQPQQIREYSGPFAVLKLRCSRAQLLPALLNKPHHLPPSLTPASTPASAPASLARQIQSAAPTQPQATASRLCSTRCPSASVQSASRVSPIHFSLMFNLLTDASAQPAVSCHLSPAASCLCSTRLPPQPNLPPAPTSRCVLLSTRMQ
jgi:hypothetical protein